MPDLSAAILLPPGPDLDPAQVLRLLHEPDTSTLTPWGRAERVFQRLIEAKIRPSQAYEGLAKVCWHTGRFKEAIQQFQAAVHADPSNRLALESLILVTDLQPETTVDQAWQCRRLWWALHGQQVTRRTHWRNTKDADRPLKVGYVSGDFYQHSSGMALQSLICGHHDSMESWCYATHDPAISDAVTAVYETTTHYQQVSRESERQLADRIYADGIDILVDLSSFTPGNRLKTFCAKPAPIQLTAWGYNLGNGFEPGVFDGIVLDREWVGADRLAEPVQPLPVAMPWTRPVMMPDVQPLPHRAPVFGAFHRLPKLNDRVLEVWASIVGAVPEARILFKGAEYSDPYIQSWIRERIPQAVFAGVTSHYEHLAAMREVDVMLDPWPQVSGVTACEALSMGVPIVTWRGDRTIQRGSASILRHVGLTMCIAETLNDYTCRAVAAITDRAWLARQRESLRERLMASPICAGYADAVETLYRRLWTSWCKES